MSGLEPSSSDVTILSSLRRLPAVLLITMLGLTAITVISGKLSQRSADGLTEATFERQSAILLDRISDDLNHRATIASLFAAMLPANPSITSLRRWQTLAQKVQAYSMPGNDIVNVELLISSADTKPPAAQSGHPQSSHPRNSFMSHVALPAPTTSISAENPEPLLQSATQASIPASAEIDPPHPPMHRQHATSLGSMQGASFGTGEEQIPIDTATAYEARDTGRVTLSIPPLAPGKSQRYIDFYVPLFRTGSTWSQRDRERNFAGALLVRQDIESLLKSENTDDLIELSHVTSGDYTLFDNTLATAKRAIAFRPLQQQLSLDLLGRSFTIGIQERVGQRPDAQEWMPRLTWFSGLLSLLLTGGALLYLYRQMVIRDASLQRANGELTRDLSAARRSNADLESFAYIVSHDLKTPLRGLSTLNDLLLDEVNELLDDTAEMTSDVRHGKETAAGSSPDTVQSYDRRQDIVEYAARIDTQLKKMDELIKGIHQYSTIGIGNEEVETLDTRQSILDVATSLSVNDQRLELHGNFPVIDTYRIRFEQTLANLIGNAFKYHHDVEHATIAVSVSSYGGFYAFSIADNGPGIAPENHARIFEVFESIRDSETEGSGVGLSIVKKAVESLGGVVTVESTPGEGTTFRFLWPKVLAPANQAARRANGSRRA